jgi:hypothetical protein
LKTRLGHVQDKVEQENRRKQANEPWYVVLFPFGAWVSSFLMLLLACLRVAPLKKVTEILFEINVVP